MSLLHKIATASRLLIRGDWPGLRRQARQLTVDWRLRRSRGKSFVYRDLGFPLLCDQTWPDSIRAFCAPEVDAWESRIVRRWLQQGESAFDFGANVGVYTFAAAAAVGRQGLVWSVDADPNAVTSLQTAAARLDTPQVRPLHRAITAEDGSVSFYLRNSREDTGGQSIHTGAADRALSTATLVPGSTLASLLAELRIRTTPALVKVDIEGAEGMLLASCPPAWFGADGPLWIIEINPGSLANFGLTPRDIADRFTAAFDCWLLAKHPLDPAAPTLRQLTPATTFTDSHYYNLIAIPRCPRRAERTRGLTAFLRRTAASHRP